MGNLRFNIGDVVWIATWSATQDYVECPDCGGEDVYSASPKGDGSFYDDERDYYLRFAVDAIERWMRGESKTPAPDVEYDVVR